MEVDYYHIKTYDDEDKERETIRGVSHFHTVTIMKVFDREGTKAQAMAYDENGDLLHDECFSVNWGRV